MFWCWISSLSYAKVWKTVNLGNLFWRDVMTCTDLPAVSGERGVSGWGGRVEGPGLKGQEEAGDRRTGFEPNRWRRLGDVPSPGLSAVIEDNLSAHREQACPLSGRGKGGEVNMKKILHYHRLCVASRALSPVPGLILASGCEDEVLSPWVGV